MKVLAISQLRFGGRVVLKQCIFLHDVKNLSCLRLYMKGCAFS